MKTRHANNVIAKARDLSETGVEVPNYFLSPFSATKSAITCSIPNSKSTPSFTFSSPKPSSGLNSREISSVGGVVISCGRNNSSSSIVSSEESLKNGQQKSAPPTESSAKTITNNNKKVETATTNVLQSCKSYSVDGGLPQRRHSGLLFRRTPSNVSVTSCVSKEERRSSSVSRLPVQTGRHSLGKPSQVSKSKIPSALNSCLESNHFSRRRVSLQGLQETGLRSSRVEEENEARKSKASYLSVNGLERRQGSDEMPSSCQSSSTSAFKSTVHELQLKLQQHSSEANNVMKRNQVSSSVKASMQSNGVVPATSTKSLVSCVSTSTSNVSSFSRRNSLIYSNNNGYWIPYRKEAKAGSFIARDNVCNFISWCRSLGIRDCLLFESDDLVLGKNQKSFVLCLLEVARKGSMVGMNIPLLIQMEQEIDEEMMNMTDDIMNSMTLFEEKKHEDQHDSQYNSETDSDAPNYCFPQPQIVTNDLRSLHERVSITSWTI